MDEGAPLAEPTVLGALVALVGLAVASLAGFSVRDCLVCTHEEVYGLLAGAALVGLGAWLHQARSGRTPLLRAVLVGTASTAGLVVGYVVRVVGWELLGG